MHGNADSDGAGGHGLGDGDGHAPRRTAHGTRFHAPRRPVTCEPVGKRGKARAAAYRVALGEAKELIVALDCVEIDQLAPLNEITATQELADRVSAMLTKLIRSTETQPLQRRS